ncbi:SDR family NAD(P)-dependent oxidoreductase [Nocardia macrotermitis]|uniref:Oxidoreductase UcpA n=1 Tax=Nocardia macrotermitis TaxID=2585198 RepID=A0A7K0CY85_9NOCA|nr:SDR family oxidoreductase [Nocardia macrotermitis]MQY18378.1 Oxidoreductase UcpA [Nocardia macrotermitis]
MPYNFADMTFVITGATKGIGAGCARVAARYGANVVVSGTSAERGKDVVEQIRTAGGEASFVACDVRHPEQVEQLMASAAAIYGGIDVLHNNAGVTETALTSQLSLADMPVETFDEVLGINLRGPWLCAKYALPYLKSSTRNPSIINTASTGSFVAFPGCTAYGASKGGLGLLTKNLAMELSPSGIRVNALAPGLTGTEMVVDYLDTMGDPEEALRKLTGTQLVPRLGEPDEIAELLCFLASDKALFVNGVVWLVDGGTLAWRGSNA